MQKAFDKIIERLEEQSHEVRCPGETIKYLDCEEAIEIVKEVAEECKKDILYQLAEVYAINFKKYGIDVTAKLETAAQNAFAMNQAYMRGRQDERDKFDKWRKEFSHRSNGWWDDMDADCGWKIIAWQQIPEPYKEK